MQDCLRLLFWCLHKPHTIPGKSSRNLGSVPWNFHSDSLIAEPYMVLTPPQMGRENAAPILRNPPRTAACLFLFPRVLPAPEAQRSLQGLLLGSTCFYRLGQDRLWCSFLALPATALPIPGKSKRWWKQLRPFQTDSEPEN